MLKIKNIWIGAAMYRTCRLLPNSKLKKKQHYKFETEI